ncbi:MAG: ABC transporter ATP-binding protein [Acidiferrobacterales bacterium]|nr:ABC transporter ATP-binding protein [Acidiferrobacterales bacterium]
MAVPVLETRSLHKNFGAVIAAADINITVEESEVIGIIGANGAGKTTLVNMITGYLEPSAGSIHYAGRNITSLSPREITRLGISRSFQIPQLFAELPVLDNLLIALGVARSVQHGFWRRLRNDEMLGEAQTTLDRYGIAGYRDQTAGMLPQGVRKLLDIAMAMVGKPKLVLLDEPTSGISVDEKFMIMDTLIGALQQQAVTVLFVEHDMEIVERYAPRVVAFYDGHIIADGPAAQVLAADDVRQYVVGAELHRRADLAGGGGC